MQRVREIERKTRSGKMEKVITFEWRGTVQGPSPMQEKLKHKAMEIEHRPFVLPLVNQNEQDIKKLNILNVHNNWPTEGHRPVLLRKCRIGVYYAHRASPNTERCV